MTYITECPDCNCKFEYSDEIELQEGSCPNCGKKYSVDFDCDDMYDAVLIPRWEEN